MCHDTIFVIQPPRRPGRRPPPDIFAALTSLLLAILVQFVLFFVFWIMFEIGPDVVRAGIIILGVLYVVTVVSIVYLLGVGIVGHYRESAAARKAAHAQSNPTAIASTEARPDERKPCPGPLDSGVSPCPLRTQIPIGAARCAYCERLRPRR